MTTPTTTTPEPAAIWVPISELHEWAENPRKNEKAIPKVAESIKRFGFGAPILAREANGEIIAGHTRFAAAKKLGLDRVPVRYMRLEPDEAHLLALADNRDGEIASWDDDKLAGLLSKLKAEDRRAVGFEDRDYNKLINLARGGSPAARGSDDVPASPEPRVKAGELWQLGEHRLLCGDSTDPANVARVMGGELADMMWTDPPYGVSYVGGTKNALTIENDALKAEDLEVFLKKAFVAADGALSDGAAIYIAHPDIRQHEFLHAILETKWRFLQTIVWVKDSLVLSRRDYHYRHEGIFYVRKPSKTPKSRMGGNGWFGDDAQATVFEYPKPKTNDMHPTMKPIELVVKMVNNSSPPNGIVFEPFAGSGTTLLACEQLGRRCRAIELDPKYADVVIARWEQATGKKAVLKDGQLKQA